MNSSAFIIFGLPGSDRSGIASYLIHHGTEFEGPIKVCCSADEPGLQALDGFASIESFEIEMLSDVVEQEGLVFLLPPANVDPVDVMEMLAKLHNAWGFEPARILTAVDCRLTSERPKELVPWYRACIHFSDVVLLNRREGVSEKWIRSFLEYFEKEHYPCIFRYVKKGRIDSPAELLDPEPRRLSLVFDGIDAVDRIEFDEENLPEGVIDLNAVTDPYFERLPSGQRVLRVPDITAVLETEAPR